jgi:hypothetical protein
MTDYLVKQNGRTPPPTAYCSLFIPRTGWPIIRDAILRPFFGRKVTGEQTANMVDGIVVIGEPQPGGVVVAGRQDVLYFSASNDYAVQERQSCMDKLSLSRKSMSVYKSYHRTN